MNSFHPICTLRLNETTGGFVSAPDVRSTMNIVWSCLSVLILSTWSILHPNVPADLRPRNGREYVLRKLHLFFRKVLWMALMLFAPESLTSLYTLKILSGKRNSVRLKELAKEDHVPWSVAHTLLADMGGFAICFPDIESAKSAVRLMEEEMSGIETEEEKKARKAEKAEVAKELEPTTELESTIELESTTKLDFLATFIRRQERWLGCCGAFPWKPYRRHFENAKLVGKDLEKEKMHWKLRNLAALCGTVWVLDSNQLIRAREHGIIKKLPNIEKVQLNDKNKSDPLVKLLAVLQVLWLIVQLIARKIGGLSSTPLEISTVASAISAFILYIVEWHKPKDVGIPIYVKADKEEVEENAFREIFKAAPYPYLPLPFI
ncbi:hypothetical protein PT974_04893 [Cladobotryum mycophilum]|uniref:Uncharacterized protein n=1 Tax=Cladobotryum mycophilum TaxID=491253 RepID=A0ABR0SQG1_9HYPO